MSSDESSSAGSSPQVVKTIAELFEERRSMQCYTAYGIFFQLFAETFKEDKPGVKITLQMQKKMELAWDVSIHINFFNNLI